MNKLTLTTDTDRKGLKAIFEDWKIVVIDHLFSVDKTSSARTWNYVIKESVWAAEGNTVSRASVIFFLNKLVDEDLLEFEDATGKGGHHRLYKMNMSRQEFVKKIIEKFVKKLHEIMELENIEFDSDPFFRAR